jgi:hypothetical protein
VHVDQRYREQSVFGHVSAHLGVSDSDTPEVDDSVRDAAAQPELLLRMIQNGDGRAVGIGERNDWSYIVSVMVQNNEIGVGARKTPKVHGFVALAQIRPVNHEGAGSSANRFGDPGGRR